MLIQQDIIWLQIPVHDMQLMQRINSKHELCYIKLRYSFIQRIVLFQDFVEIPAWEILLHEAEIPFMRERVQCFGYVVTCYAFVHISFHFQTL